MARALLALALALALLPFSAVADEIKGAFVEQDSGGVTTFVVGANRAINDFTEPVSISPGMFIVFSQANAAVVSAYAVGPNDDDVASIEAGTLIKQYTTSTAEAMTVTTGFNVRFVIDTAENVATPSFIRVFTSPIKVGGGGAPAAEYAALSSIDETTITHVTVIDCDDLTCASPGTGSTRVPFYYNGSAWVPFPGAAAGIASVAEDTSPQLGGDLDGQGNDIVGAGSIEAKNIGGVYYCDQYAGADIFEQCAAAIAAAYADAPNKSPTIRLPPSATDFVVNTELDVCQEDRALWAGGRIEGAGASGAGASATVVRAGSGFPSDVVDKNGGTYSIVVNVTPAGETVPRDTITCSDCDFRAAGIRRGDLIETSGWATAGNNYGASSTTAGRPPLKVYRAEAQTLYLEDERTANPALTAVTNTATGDVRRLKPMIKTCGGAWHVSGVYLDGDNYADMLNHNAPDNQPYRECSAIDTPYNGASGSIDCTGEGAGTPTAANSQIGGGLHGVWGADAIYANVAHTALEIAGQADHWVIDQGSHFWGAIDSVWYDGLQAQPGVTVRDSQLEAFKRSGLRLSSGTAILDNATVISGDTDCKNDAYGTSSHIWVSYENVVGLALKGKTNIEVKCGQGIHVVNGGGTQNGLRGLDLSGAWILANDPDVTDLISAPNACLAVNIEGTRFKDNNGPVSASLITFGNANQGTLCNGWIAGRADYADQGPVGFAPQLVVNDGIPVGVMSDSGVGGGYATVDDEDTPLTQRTSLNFEGAGVTCADDTDQTTCTIPGGAAGTVDTANSPLANEFARFTDPDTIEGRTASEARADIGANDAANLTTGTLPAARIGAASIDATKVAADVATQAELDAKTLPGSQTDNRLVRTDGTGGDVQPTGISVDDSDNVSGIGTLAADEVDTTAPAGTGVATHTWKEGVSHGTDTLVVSGPAGGWGTGGRTCTLEDDDTPYDGCITPGSTATQHKTRVCSIPIVADASGALTHVDQIARCKVPDASTLVKVSCTSGQANGFSIQLFERGSTTPNTGTTDMLGGSLACDTDNQEDTAFSDSTIAADAYLVLDIVSESLAAGEHGFVAIEYTVD